MVVVVVVVVVELVVVVAVAEVGAGVQEWQSSKQRTEKPGSQTGKKPQ